MCVREHNQKNVMTLRGETRQWTHPSHPTSLEHVCSTFGLAAHKNQLSLHPWRRWATKSLVHQPPFWNLHPWRYRAPKRLVHQPPIWRLRLVIKRRRTLMLTTPTPPRDFYPQPFGIKVLLAPKRINYERSTKAIG